MQLQKQQQQDNKLSLTRLSINEQGKLFQRKGKYRPGYMNQALSYILLIIALSAISSAVAGSHSVSKTYILLNIGAYSCVIAIMLESKHNERQGLFIIIMMSALNAIIIILAIFKVF